MADVQRVQIRMRPSTILNYVPPKGIDITFDQVDLENTAHNSPKIYDVSIVTSSIHPDYPKEPRHVTELLAGWKNLVSDRVSSQNRKPLIHRIVTMTNRPEIQNDPEKKERADKQTKFKDEFGNDLVEYSGEVKERN